MGIYYPQGVMTMRVILEDFGRNTDIKLNKVHSFTVLCRSITVNLNSYREADSFNAEIDFKNFPFDPRTIRTAGVTIHIEDREKLFKENNSLNILTPTEESTVFQGYVDEDSISLDKDSRTVALKGRDFTSILIDQPYFGKPVATSVPLDQVIRLLMDEIPQTRVVAEEPNSGIEIVNKTGEPLPVLAGLDDNKGKSAGKSNGRKNRSYWDKIQDIITESGFIAYIALDKLIITKPRYLYDSNRSEARVFVYGTNLGSLEFSRKLGRQKDVNVRVIAFSQSAKKVVKAYLPRDGTDEWAKKLGVRQEDIKVPTIKKNGEKGDPKTAPFITFSVNNVTDQPHCVSVGEGIFEELGRQQIEGTLSTKEMAVCTKDDKRLSSTLIRVGDALEVSIDQGDLEGMPDLIKLLKPKIDGKAATTETRQAAQKTIKQYLTSQCYSDEVADAMSISLTKFDTPFYTRSVEYSLTQDGGFAMEIEFLNFIELPKRLRDPLA